MLQLKNIVKTYGKVYSEQVQALKGIDLEFREKEFVSILGQSGCGKTTLLNIIGGLDRYTSGDLIINGKSTKDFKDRDWDRYRNYTVGFIFQSYNLISHQSVLSNVELALTISGVSKKEKRNLAIKALEDVGLKDQMHKRPNQLSGGQMQRVAIARALVNNPDIILADEPTGALDTKTSVQVMDILKNISKDKLVIVVTHNKELAEKYSSRIIKILDGKITDDSNPITQDEKKEAQNKYEESNKRTSMKFFTAFKLSLNNLMTKKGRTILTAFAGSIGIIGIALILSLSNGVQEYINRVQEEALTSYPLTIEQDTIDLSSAIMASNEEAMKNLNSTEEHKDKIYSNDAMTETMSIMSSQVKSNNLQAFKEYIESNKSNIKDYTTAISYNYKLDLQLFKPDTEKVVQVNPNTVLESIGMPTSGTMVNYMLNDVFFEMFENDAINNKMYEIVKGRMPTKYNEVVLQVDENNRISDYVLYALGLKDQDELEEMYDKITKGQEIETKQVSYDFDELIGLKYKLLLNTDYYEKVNNIWVDKSKDEEYIKEKLKNAEEIEVVGIVKPNEDWSGSNTAIGGILYLDSLEKYVIDKINNSDIVKEQKENKDVNVITGLKFSDKEFNIEDLSNEQKMYLQSLSPEELTDIISNFREQAEATYDSVLVKLGAVDLNKPSGIDIYAKDFEAKEKIKEIIDNYNDTKKQEDNEEDVINYTDLVGMLMSSVTSIVDMISYVLIAFVSISLVVSSIMIGIITYISVLERTKEIGILRAIGASKKDISRVFNAETLIVGLVAGLLGILVTLLLNIPINMIIKTLADVDNLTRLPFGGAIILIIISVILTMIAGLIPSRIASKKDPVEALRSE